MPSRAQNGGSISDSFAQQSAHRPALPASGARQDGHNGGSTTSSASRPARRKASPARAKGACSGLPVAGIGMATA
jgi:hypothetical protein